MNKKLLFLTGLVCSSLWASAQLSPAVTEWLINTTDIVGRHYIEGNSMPITDTAHANVQLVQYSNDYSYVHCSGIPAYIVGPYLDNNPAQATHNHWLFKIPLNPTMNTGTTVETPVGAIGIFINGVPMYDYKDVKSYKLSTQSDDNNGDGVWNRNAILAENEGFDCAKGHPSPVFSGGGGGMQLEGGSYHHHQNPTAFNLDQVEVSDICDLYLSDGLYTIDSNQHSPLIGFAFDGYPVYGAYAYGNPNGGGPIKRMRSSYQKRNIMQRTHYADGTDVTDGPPVNSSYPIGWYKEDYEYIQGSGDLDEHNGRFCVTPEYPNGTYAYFATVDQNWNSAYPYMVGPEYYGVVLEDNFTNGGTNSITVNEPVMNYNPNTSGIKASNIVNSVTVFPNPTSDLIAIQINGLLRSDLTVNLYDLSGRLVKSTNVRQGSTIWYLDTRTLYNGEYVVQISDGEHTISESVIISK